MREGKDHMEVFWGGLERYLSAVVDVDEVCEKTKEAYHLAVGQDPLKLQRF